MTSQSWPIVPSTGRSLLPPATKRGRTPTEATPARPAPELLPFSAGLALRRRSTAAPTPGGRVRRHDGRCPGPPPPRRCCRAARMLPPATAAARVVPRQRLAHQARHQFAPRHTPVQVRPDHHATHLHHPAVCPPRRQSLAPPIPARNPLVCVRWQRLSGSLAPIRRAALPHILSRRPTAIHRE